jgi:chemotaxis protein MotB
MKNSIALFYSILVTLSSCVTPKIHNALHTEYNNAKLQIVKKNKENISLSEKVEELEGKISTIRKQLDSMRNDSIQNGKALSNLQNSYDELSSTYDLLASKNSRNMAEKAKETKELLKQLGEIQNSLLTKEDDLNNLSNSLAEKQLALEKAQEELEERSARVAELEYIINKKDSMVTTLKQRISKALIGLEGEGLTVVQKNGKVYISLEEDLLFASGKYQVGTAGISALNKLSAALADQKDLEILVEGHTDSIPISKGTVKDNWDLSVLRATAVVKVLMSNPNLSPIQLTAAGRGEHMPFKDNATSEGRAANRRIEIILAPNLDDLFDLLEE